LILLTTDGPTTQRVLKSETQKWKTYLIETDKRASDSDIAKLSEGVEIISHTSRDGKTKTRLITTSPAVVERGPQSKKYRNQLLIQIHEGKNRQIRRMCTALGMEVKRLHRIDFAGISLEDLSSPGEWAFLTPKEVEILKSY
jgi:pseudouridine synthase